MHKYILAMLSICVAVPVYAGAVDDLQQEYKAAGVASFSAERGAQLWSAQHKDAESGKLINCQTCHTTDLKRAGQHNKTGKAIEPMAPSVNPKRLTEVKQINKWFTRNCKQVLGRECTAQEKGDVLEFLKKQ